MANGTKKQTVAILMLVIAVIGLTAATVTKFYSLKSRVKDLEKRCPEGYKHLPIGSIVAYHGTGKPPSGWLLCDDKEIPAGDEYETLRGILKENKTPDLQGMFLRGAGQNENSNYQYAGDKDRLVGSPQGHATALPTEKPFKTDMEDKHDHGGKAPLSKTVLTWEGGGDRSATFLDKDARGEDIYAEIDMDGNHDHSIIDGGDEETRPNNYTVNFIIKAF